MTAIHCFTFTHMHTPPRMSASIDDKQNDCTLRRIANLLDTASTLLTASGINTAVRACNQVCLKHVAETACGSSERSVCVVVLVI
jgi:hypothetical protein